MGQTRRESARGQTGRESTEDKICRECTMNQTGRESTWSIHEERVRGLYWQRESTVNKTDKESTMGQMGRESTVGQTGRENGSNRKRDYSGHDRQRAFNEPHRKREYMVYTESGSTLNQRVKENTRDKIKEDSEAVTHFPRKCSGGCRSTVFLSDRRITFSWNVGLGNPG